MNLCGFLAPDGTFTECLVWAHTSMTEIICKMTYKKKCVTGIEAEDFLYEQGYVGFYSRSVSHRWLINHHFCMLTDEQFAFILSNKANALNSDQENSINELLQWNDDYKESSILSHYERVM